MAKKGSRYRKRDSDRSGFTVKANTMVRDRGALVSPDEFDSPPPDKRSLGGEGDISTGDQRPNSDTYTTPPDIQNVVQSITAAGGVSFQEKTFRASNESLNFGFIYIEGNGGDVTVTKNPQVSAGRQGQRLTLQGAGSSVTLIDGSGLSLRKQIVIDSGMILNLFYSATDNLWLETSRSHLERDLGEF